jgi:ubiquinone/menaquinone biosynthesis C-methylase UbiE
MTKRVIEEHQSEYFSDPVKIKEYADYVERSSNSRFLAFISKLKKLEIPGSYLEVGSGSGKLARLLVTELPDIKITCLDASDELNKIASDLTRKANLDKNISYINGDIANPGFLEGLGKFNVIYSTFSLHHWQDPVTTFRHMNGLLNDTGIIVILDLKRVWWLYRISSQSGFFKSIRASYTINETRNILRKAEIRKFEIRTIFPFFMQMITIWKE